MRKWKPLNMELRSFVLFHVLRLEQTSSSLIKTILRLFKEDLKTIGGKSSALSFKSKIDLLYDMEEITKTEYSHLLKLMEIRNQFAHNHNAISFESLDKINPKINKYLERHTPDDIPKELNRENKLQFIFKQLFTLVCGKLLVTEIEYIDGIQEEYKAHVNNKLVENIENVWTEANLYNQQKIAEANLVITPNITFQDKLEMFRLAFMLKMSEFTSIEYDKLKENNKEIFRKKLKVEDKLKRLKENQNENE